MRCGRVFTLEGRWEHPRRGVSRSLGAVCITCVFWNRHCLFLYCGLVVVVNIQNPTQDTEYFHGGGLTALSLPPVWQHPAQ